MSTPSGDPGNPWTQPGDPTRPVPQPAQSPSGYGTPSSPSYGKYGQGQALPTAPTQPVPGSQGPWNQPAPGQPVWGQPGYVPPQSWSAPVGGPTQLRRLGALVTWTMALSVLMGIVNCLVGYLAPNENQAFRDAFNGVSSRVTTTGSPAYQTISSLGLLVEVLVWVISCLWLTRIRQNALVLQPWGQRRSEVWVWLGWIIPIVNFWFPKQLLDDAIRATAPAAGVPPIRTGSWWAAWLSSGALAFTQAVLSLMPPNDSLKLSLAVIQTVVLVTALVLWLRIVRWLSTKQDALAAERPVTTLQG